MQKNKKETIARLAFSMQATKLLHFVNIDQLVQAQLWMVGKTKEEKRELVSTEVNGSAALFHACQHGRLSFVNWLIEDCGANIEQVGRYHVEEDQSDHKVTPLWCAAVANHLGCVKSLICHGANVNATSDTDSTPVRSACFMTNIEVVKYLVEKGADIHKPNVNGGTCLINSVQNRHLCEFLIEKGVDVNVQDQSGNIALHYAVKENRLDTVKLLVESGSNVLLENMFHDDSIILAAGKGLTTIAEYLLKCVKVNDMRIIDTYKLIGCCFVDEQHDMLGGWNMWRKAIEILNESKDKEQILSQLRHIEPLDVYNDETEVCTKDDVARIAEDPDLTYMQSLVMRERIQGPEHKDTVFRLMYRGAVYADSHQFQRCVDLWLHACTMQYTRLGPLNMESLFTLQAICKLFVEINTEFKEKRTTEFVQYDDVMSIMEMIISEVELGAKLVDVRPVHKELRQQYDMKLKLLLHLINLMIDVAKSDSQDFGFKQTVHRLVKLNPETSSQDNLLHLALDADSSSVEETKISTLPSLELTELLLYCGMGSQVNDVNSSKRTPLHVLCSGKFQRHNQKLLQLMLDYGAHVCCRDDSGKATYDLIGYRTPFHLKKLTFQIIPFDHMNLKCLAAAVIKKNNVSFRENEIPASLIDYIKLH
ncbi:unnamed protein product [Owenia fusiformis]|uniref:Uncharacterized protein n=1 Tax=Owenia fusiformis TaxID=6347 RepID=A0A8J1XJS7_OWEFU|nr:unnamed protein product [Owenia fusiformis]